MQTDDTTTHYVRCLKCLKILKCSRYDTTALLQHIKENHPDVDFEGNTCFTNTTQNGPNDKEDVDKVNSFRNLAAQYGYTPDKISQISKRTGLSERQLAEEAERYLNIEIGAEDSKKDPCKKDSNDLLKRQMYRNSIEKWIPTDGAIFCPKCSVCQTPVMKTRNDAANAGGGCACCVLNCWPFCFLPCLLPQENREYMYCPNCCNFLGLYDRENNIIKPNRQYSVCKPRSANSM